MMKQLIQKAKVKFFEPDAVRAPAAQRIANHPEVGFGHQPVIVNRLSAEQQRIELLEGQIRQLRADMARWKKTSVCFAQEMRDLLTD